MYILYIVAAHGATNLSSRQVAGPIKWSFWHVAVWFTQKQVASNPKCHIVYIPPTFTLHSFAAP